MVSAHLRVLSSKLDGMLAQVTERAAGALNLKADAAEVKELRLFLKGQLADVRGRMKEGQGRGRLISTTQEGQTICLSCDQPLADPRGQQYEASTTQGGS